MRSAMLPEMYPEGGEEAPGTSAPRPSSTGTDRRPSLGASIIRSGLHAVSSIFAPAGGRSSTSAGRRSSRSKQRRKKRRRSITQASQTSGMSDSESPSRMESEDVLSSDVEQLEDLPQVQPTPRLPLERPTQQSPALPPPLRLDQPLEPPPRNPPKLSPDHPSQQPGGNLPDQPQTQSLHVISEKHTDDEAQRLSSGRDFQDSETRTDASVSSIETDWELSDAVDDSPLVISQEGNASIDDGGLAFGQLSGRRVTFDSSEPDTHLFVPDPAVSSDDDGRGASPDGSTEGHSSLHQLLDMLRQRAEANQVDEDSGDDNLYKQNTGSVDQPEEIRRVHADDDAAHTVLDEEPAYGKGRSGSLQWVRRDTFEETVDQFLHCLQMIAEEHQAHQEAMQMLDNASEADSALESQTGSEPDSTATDVDSGLATSPSSSHEGSLKADTGQLVNSDKSPPGKTDSNTGYTKTAMCSLHWGEEASQTPPYECQCCGCNPVQKLTPGSGVPGEHYEPWNINTEVTKREVQMNKGMSKVSIDFSTMNIMTEVKEKLGLKQTGGKDENETMELTEKERMDRRDDKSRTALTATPEAMAEEDLSDNMKTTAILSVISTDRNRAATSEAEDSHALSLTMKHTKETDQNLDDNEIDSGLLSYERIDFVDNFSYLQDPDRDLMEFSKRNSDNKKLTSSLLVMTSKVINERQESRNQISVANIDLEKSKNNQEDVYLESIKNFMQWDEEIWLNDNSARDSKGHIRKPKENVRIVEKNIGQPQTDLSDYKKHNQTEHTSYNLEENVTKTPNAKLVGVPKHEYHTGENDSKSRLDGKHPITENKNSEKNALPDTQSHLFGEQNLLINHTSNEHHKRLSGNMNKDAVTLSSQENDGDRLTSIKMLPFAKLEEENSEVLPVSDKQNDIQEISNIAFAITQSILDHATKLSDNAELATKSSSVADTRSVAQFVMAITRSILNETSELADDDLAQTTSTAESKTPIEEESGISAEDHSESSAPAELSDRPPTTEPDELVTDEALQGPPVEDESVQDEPVQDESIQEELVKDEFIQDKAVTEEPAKDESVPDEPVQDQITTEPVPNEPVQDEVTTDKLIQAVVADELATAEPAIGDDAGPFTSDPESAEVATDDNQTGSEADANDEFALFSGQSDATPELSEEQPPADVTDIDDEQARALAQEMLDSGRFEPDEAPGEQGDRSAAEEMEVAHAPPGQETSKGDGTEKRFSPSSYLAENFGENVFLSDSETDVERAIGSQNGTEDRPPEAPDDSGIQMDDSMMASGTQIADTQITERSKVTVELRKSWLGEEMKGPPDQPTAPTDVPAERPEQTLEKEETETTTTESTSASRETLRDDTDADATDKSSKDNVFDWLRRVSTQMDELGITDKLKEMYGDDLSEPVVIRSPEEDRDDQDEGIPKPATSDSGMYQTSSRESATQTTIEDELQTTTRQAKAPPASTYAGDGAGVGTEAGAGARVGGGAEDVVGVKTGAGFAGGVGAKNEVEVGAKVGAGPGAGVGQRAGAGVVAGAAVGPRVGAGAAVTRGARAEFSPGAGTERGGGAAPRSTPCGSCPCCLAMKREQSRSRSPSGDHASGRSPPGDRGSGRSRSRDRSSPSSRLAWRQPRLRTGPAHSVGALFDDTSSAISSVSSAAANADGSDAFGNRIRHPRQWLKAATDEFMRRECIRQVMLRNEQVKDGRTRTKVTRISRQPSSMTDCLAACRGATLQMEITKGETKVDGKTVNYQDVRIRTPRACKSPPQRQSPCRIKPATAEPPGKIDTLVSRVRSASSGRGDRKTKRRKNITIQTCFRQ